MTQDVLEQPRDEVPEGELVLVPNPVALFAYGVFLVGDGAWNVDEADEETGLPQTPWQGRGVDRFGKPLPEADTALLALYGRVPGVPDVAPEDPAEWRRAVYEYFGVMILHIGAPDEDSRLLVAHAEVCEPNEVLTHIDARALVDMERREEFGLKLEQVCQILGVTPRDEPGWMIAMASYNPLDQGEDPGENPVADGPWIV